MTQFEHKILYVRFQPCDENELDRHGLEGWELVSIISHATTPLGYTYTFKRPLKSDPIQTQGGYFIPPLTFTEDERQAIIEALANNVTQIETLK